MEWKNVELITNLDYCDALGTIDSMHEGACFMELVRAENPSADRDIGYLIGYLSAQDRGRLYALLNLEHPFFGTRDVSAEEAFQMGQEFAASTLGRVNEAGLQFIGVDSSGEMELGLCVNDQRGSLFMSREGLTALTKQFDIGLVKAAHKVLVVHNAVAALEVAGAAYRSAHGGQEEARENLLTALGTVVSAAPEDLRLGTRKCEASITGKCFYDMSEDGEEACLACRRPDEKK